MRLLPTQKFRYQFDILDLKIFLIIRNRFFTTYANSAEVQKNCTNLESQL